MAQKEIRRNSKKNLASRVFAAAAWEWGDKKMSERRWEQ